MGALTRVAHALGVEDGDGCVCTVCGASPFAAQRRGSLRTLFGDGFDDFSALADPACDMLCAGCARLLAGRPGDNPRPLRMDSIALIAGDLYRPDRGELWGYLIDPPPDLEVLSWAVTRKRHHILYAGACSPDRMPIGSDGEAIVYVPGRDMNLLCAIAELRAAGASRTAINTGHYTPQQVRRIGAGRWSTLERQIAPRRGDAVWRLAIAHVPDGEAPPHEEGSVIDPVDDQAARLLGAIARGSTLRVEQGVDFWRGLFIRRIRRNAHRPLSELVSRLMSDIATEPTGEGAQTAKGMLAAWTADEEKQIRQRIQERTDLLVALSFEHRKRETTE